MLNLNKCTKTKPQPTLIYKNCSCVCEYHSAQLSYTTLADSHLDAEGRETQNFCVAAPTGDQELTK